MHYIGFGIVFLLFSAAFLFLFNYIEEQRLIGKTYDKLKEGSEKRQRDAEYKLIIEGNTQTQSFFTKLDTLLVQSGLTRSFPFIISETYMAIAILLGITAYIIVQLLTGVFVYGIASGVIIVACMYILLSIMSNSKFRDIEEDMTLFLDMLAAYSKSSDDIVDIMGKVYPSLHYPLNEYVEEFYYESINAGTETAFRHLRYKIPHKKLREILGNLELCSKQLTDYGSIIDESQEQLRTYLNGKRERAEVKKNGGMELAVFGIMGVIMVFMLNNLLGYSVIELLINNFAGQCIIAYLGIIIILCLMEVFSFERE